MGKYLIDVQTSDGWIRRNNNKNECTTVKSVRQCWYRTKRLESWNAKEEKKKKKI